MYVRQPDVNSTSTWRALQVKSVFSVGPGDKQQILQYILHPPLSDPGPTEATFGPHISHCSMRETEV